jgi:hypothetical protein
LQNRVERIFPTGGGMMTYPTERDPRLERVCKSCLMDNVPTGR